MKKIRQVFAFVLMCMLLLTSCGHQPTWQEQYDLGVHYLSEGNYEEAIIAFTAAIEIDPKRAEAYVGRGDTYIGSGETEDNLAAALADYEAAIALDESVPEAWLGLADVYIRQGEYDRALEILQQSLEKAKSNQNILDKIAEIESGIYADSSGNVRRLNHYDADGILIGYVVNGYDEVGNEISRSFSPEGELEGYEVRETTMNEYGFTEILSQFSSDDTLQYRQIYEYDIGSKLVKLSNYNENNELESYETYEREGNCETGYRFDAENHLLGYSIVEYSEDGMPLKSSSYSGDGSLRGYITYEYADDGTMVRQNFYDENGILTRYSDFT